MIKAIIVDARKDFLEDIQIRMCLYDKDKDGPLDVDIVSTLESTENLNNAISSFNPDIIVVSENLIDSQEDWNFRDIDVVSYALNKEGAKILKGYDIPTYGIVKNDLHLLRLLNCPIPKNGVLSENLTHEQEIKRNKFEYEKRPKRKEEVFDDKYDDGYDDKDKDKAIEDEEYIDDYPKKQRQNNHDNRYKEKRPHQSYRNAKEYYDDYYELSNSKNDIDEDECDEYYDKYEDDNCIYEREKENNRSKISGDRNEHVKRESFQSELRKNRNIYNDYKYKEVPRREPQSKISNDIKDKRHARDIREQERRNIYHEVERDLNRYDKHDTKVITVYSAKGGVGKTTISTNIATYLALTSHSRGKYRVCIIDYNIDFGDVRLTLGFDNDGHDMSLWAMDIKERIANGERLEDIWYTTEEIEDYLQEIKKTGVYGLLAPLTHEESMDIEREELEIMIRNIVKQGGFDFVICDTGNNTRDCTIFALEAADLVLLIATQDATTANCNDSSLEALNKIGFDLDKVKLIINCVKSTKATGIPVQDVIEAFPYPCIAKIKNNIDVTKSNNYSQPMVLQPNHEFTKELRNVIRVITGDRAERVFEKKKFSLFKKRDR